MTKTMIEGPGDRRELPALLEGYLYGLGEVCHRLFGNEGEAAIYEAIGEFFVSYLHRHLGIRFTEEVPWDRFCQITKVFTEHGFYSHVELEQMPEGRYRMLERGQYAGEVWEGQKSWVRGTPPCPLWATLLYSLSQVGVRICLDTLHYSEDNQGYESTFHFEGLECPPVGTLQGARAAIRNSLLPICFSCKRIRDDDEGWVPADRYFSEKFEARFSHGVCPDCLKSLKATPAGEVLRPHINDKVSLQNAPDASHRA